MLEKWNNHQLAPLFVTRKLLSSVTEKEQAIESLTRDVDDKEQAIQSLTRAVEDREQAIQSLTRAVEDRERAVESLTRDVEDKEQAIQSLTRDVEDKEHALRTITRTPGWRLLQLYGKIKYPYLLPIYRFLRLLPRDSLSRDRTARLNSSDS